MNYEPITAEHEAELIVRAQTGDRKAADALVRAYEPLAAGMAAKRHAKTGLEFDDLAQAARMGLWIAVPKFDLSKGYRFSTYARWVIGSALTAEVGKTMTMIHIPRDDRRAGLEGSLKPDAQADFQRAHVPALDVEEHTVTSNAEVELFQLIHGRQTAARVREAVATLEDRERYIVEQTMLANPKRTLDSVGEELGISRQRTKQIRDDAYGRLRKRLRGVGG